MLWQAQSFEPGRSQSSKEQYELIMNGLDKAERASVTE